MLLKDIAKDYVGRYPQKRSTWIAQKLVEDGHWNTVEPARMAVRTVRGKMGEYHRQQRRNEQEYWQHRDGRPYVLLLDIETAPLVGYVWGTYKQNIAPSQLIHGPCLISWAAKWLYDDKTKSDILTAEEARNRDDRRITESVWQWIDKADIIVAHNGDKFDLPFCNSRFVVHGLKPPSPFQTIDTLRVAKANKWGFRFSSNKLDSICLDLGLPRKIHTDFSLWSRCMDGEKQALKEMIEYNRNDVGILEEVYVRLRPWIKSHPNLGLYVESDGEVCGHCGSSQLEWPEGQYYYTTVGKYSSGRCLHCGAIMRSRVTALSNKMRQKLLSTTAR